MHESSHCKEALTMLGTIMAEPGAENAEALEALVDLFKVSASLFVPMVHCFSSWCVGCEEHHWHAVHIFVASVSVRYLFVFELIMKVSSKDHLVVVDPGHEWPVDPHHHAGLDGGGDLVS